MKNHERPSGSIESTKSIWDVSAIEKEYYNANGEYVSPQNYEGNGEIYYNRYSSSQIKEGVESLSERSSAREDHLIYTLSQLYGKRDGKYLSKVLEKVENNADDWYNKKYDGSPNIGYNYLKYLREHNDERYDEDFYKFTQWYDYAFKRYAREKFLPEARRHETEYAAKIRAKIESGLLPASTEAKLAQFDTHTIKYGLIDAFNDQDIGGQCAKRDKDDGPEIMYHVDFGLSDEDALPSHYQSGVSDFRNVMTHESTHLLFPSLFGVYDNDANEDWTTIHKRREALSQTLSEPQLETVEEADRIITEGTVEWITQILNKSTDTSKADTSGGAYHTERQVLDSLLNDGEKKIDAKELFSLCAYGSEEIEENRRKFLDSLFLAYPDCKNKMDLAEKIVERFNWFEWQDSEN